MSMTYASTQAALAAAVGVGRRTIADWQKKLGFPPRTKRGWNIGRVMAWHATRTGEAEMMEAGGPSPALERWREARAKLSELELARQQGLLVSAAVMQQGLQLFASTMRTVFGELRAQFGEEAYSIVADGLDLSEQQFRKLAREANGDGASGGDAGEADADDSQPADANA